MTKYEQSEYLVNLLAIIDSKRAAGHSLPGDTLSTEYALAYDDFIKLLKDDQGKSKPKEKH